MESTTRRSGRVASAIVPVLTAWLVAASGPASAGVYCCHDATGKKVCGDVMPSACIGRDTTLKSERGTTKQIPGMLTPEQRAQRDEEAARKQEIDAANREKRRQDQALLNTYTSVKDIDIARGRAEKEVAAQIEAAEKKIAAATARRKKLDGEAEFYKNKPLPEELRRSIKDTEFEVSSQGELIENKKKELDAVRAKFDLDRKRYEELIKARAAPR